VNPVVIPDTPISPGSNEVVGQIENHKECALGHDALPKTLQLENHWEQFMIEPYWLLNEEKRVDVARTQVAVYG
jgi:hypothetical protein